MYHSIEYVFVRTHIRMEGGNVKDRTQTQTQVVVVVVIECIEALLDFRNMF
jgi:hypothetical protein